MRELGLELNFEKAWRQKDSLRYDWMTSPQTFVYKFKYQYAAIRGTFQEATLPDRDKVIKRKLLQGFPMESRDWL